jgi:aminoglycoside 3-N-acetyltransferase I
MRTKRLTSTDRELAKKLFATMAMIFADECSPLSDEYVDRLLSSEDVFAVAAFDENNIIGGLTAHMLPMTRSESSEIFIYDLAVLAEYRRMGVGRMLMMALRSTATAAGMQDVFVPVDNDDLHAIEFYRALGGTASPVTFFSFSDRGRSAPGVK